MKLVTIGAACAMAVMLAAGASAQSGGTMAEGAKTATYTGCIEAGGKAGTFMLTHAVADGAMGMDAMGKNTMAKDGMTKDAMTKPLTLSGTAVDLSQHVGHKVSVTGSSSGKTGFVVTSLTMIATSCQ